MNIQTDLSVFVLHDLGDEMAGQAWREAFAAAGWQGSVIAPDLPGHGSAPAPIGGSYELGDGILVAAELIDVEAPAPIVVGVGLNGWAAQLLALAGRAAALVLVDGLHGPWVAPAAWIGGGRAWLRAVADNPAATAPPPARGLDPRAAHRIPPLGSRSLALRAARSMPVPTLLLESPASRLAPAEVDELAEAFAAGATVRPIVEATAHASVSIIAEVAAEFAALPAAAGLRAT